MLHKIQEVNVVIQNIRRVGVLKIMLHKIQKVKVVILVYFPTCKLNIDG